MKIGFERNFKSQKNGNLGGLEMENHMIQLFENPMFISSRSPQIKVRLNLHINSTLMSHQMVFTFCAHILNSYIAWHSRNVTLP